MKIHLYKTEPIHFFYKDNDGVHIVNWKFIIHWCRWNKKPFPKLCILIRTPLLCLERNSSGTKIGNKSVVWFIKEPKVRKINDKRAVNRDS